MTSDAREFRALDRVVRAARSLMTRDDFWNAVLRDRGCLPGEYDDLRDALALPVEPASGPANMYGCTPCPKCGSTFRCRFARTPDRVDCDDCGHAEPAPLAADDLDRAGKESGGTP